MEAMGMATGITSDIVEESVRQDEFHALSDPGAYDDIVSYDVVHDGANIGAEDADPELDLDVLVTTTSYPPVHPVPSLQGAFEESYYESATPTRDSLLLDVNDDFDDDNNNNHNNNAEMRRRQLLEAECYEDGWVTKWKPRRGAKYHPYLKLIAQIVFGMHLLEQEQAKSNAEVVRILQHHVDEVDAFLERTWEDFELANKDIEDRVRFLKMPMNHTEVFEKMLDEKKFRTELLKGNEKLEKIVDRTTKAMNSALSDIQAGIKATEELSVYLSGVKRRWPMENLEIADVLSAMKGNEQGWMAFLRDLQRKGSALGKNLNILNVLVAEIAKRAAAASRRNKPQRTVSPTKSSSSPGVRSKFTRDASSKKLGAWTNKPLPQEPKPRLTISKPISLSTGDGKTQTTISSSRPMKGEESSSPRPKTAGYVGGTTGTPRPTQSEDMRELAAFLRQSGPLRSHPPDIPSTTITTTTTTPTPQALLLPTRTASLSKLRGDSEALIIHSSGRKPNRTQSQGGNVGLGNFNHHSVKKVGNPYLERSLSQRSAAATTTAATGDAPPSIGRTPSKTKIIKRSVISSPKIFRPDSPKMVENERPTTSTGFTRRLSKRLKILPPQQPQQPQSPTLIFSPNKPDLSPRAIDSAFSNHVVEKGFSSSSSSSSSPTSTTANTNTGTGTGTVGTRVFTSSGSSGSSGKHEVVEKPFTPPNNTGTSSSKNSSSKNSSNNTTPKRPASRLVLFPKPTLTPPPPRRPSTSPSTTTTTPQTAQRNLSIGEENSSTGRNFTPTSIPTSFPTATTMNSSSKNSSPIKQEEKRQQQQQQQQQQHKAHASKSSVSMSLRNFFSQHRRVGSLGVF